MPLPAGDGVTCKEYAFAVEHALAEKVRVAAEGMAAGGGGVKAKEKADGKTETSRAVECFKVLAGMEKFGLSQDGTTYRISIPVMDKESASREKTLLHWLYPLIKVPELYGLFTE